MNQMIQNHYHSIILQFYQLKLLGNKCALKDQKTNESSMMGHHRIIIIWALPFSPFDLILMNSGPMKPEFCIYLSFKGLFICTSTMTYNENYAIS